ncbi:MAG: hypothetical protein WC931_04200 [Bacilli bacterium]|jgi:hypothetical protein
MNDRNSSISWGNFLDRLRKDPELLHELVTNTSETLSNIEGISSSLRDRISEMSSDNLLAATMSSTVGPINACGETCGLSSCDFTCGASCDNTCDSSCTDTCTDSCSGTCAQPSCAYTSSKQGDIYSNPPDYFSQTARGKFSAWRRK